MCHIMNQYHASDFLKGRLIFVQFFSWLAFMGANGIQVDPSEPSVLSLVERSPLVILQQLVSTGPAGWSLACSHSPKRGRAHPSLWLQWGWGMLLHEVVSLKGNRDETAKLIVSRIE